MHRRDFLTISGVGLAGLMLPYSRSIAAQELVSGLDVALKKAIADAALNAATGAILKQETERAKRADRGTGMMRAIAAWAPPARCRQCCSRSCWCSRGR